MRRLLGITGTPGTGKKTVAPLVAARLGLRCVALNDFAPSWKDVVAGRSTIDVDPAALRRRLLANVTGPCLVHGHMLPDTLRKGDVERVVVLRCDPTVLKRRLTERDYSHAKTLANVEAELIGLVFSLSLSRFGRKKVHEFDTSSTSPERAAAAVARLLRRRVGGRVGVDWLRNYGSAVKLRSLLSVESTDSART